MAAPRSRSANAEYGRDGKEQARQRDLVRLLQLSIAAAIVTIALKTVAWALTGSIGLLSDAAESIVNLVAALVALLAVQWAARPPDEDHAYGHDKADYFSAGFEGGLVLLAALAIIVFSVARIFHPTSIDHVAIGVTVTAIASVINLVVGRRLIRAGVDYGSITLEADGRHLMTDVWTSAGVITGVIVVAVTGLERLDGVIALIVGINVLRTGIDLVKRSGAGLMDRALEPDELVAVKAVLDALTTAEVSFHALRTRRAGRRAFVSVHVLVPGAWSVQRGHDQVEIVEAELRRAGGFGTVFTHLEPIEDPVSHQDTTLDRVAGEH